MPYLLISDPYEVFCFHRAMRHGKDHPIRNTIKGITIQEKTVLHKKNIGFNIRPVHFRGIP